MPRLRVPPRLGRALARESDLWAVALVAIPLFAVGAALLASPVDPDYWWHLSTGRWMLSHHRVPHTDPFSWTHGGQSWVAHEWLAELLLALADGAGGYAAAMVLTAVLALCGYWLLLDGARGYGLSRRALCLLMLLWGGISLRSVAVRPQVWGWALLCVELWLLAGYDTGRRRRLWLLPPLFALWINLHLTALIGIGCLGLFALGRVLRRRPDTHLLLICLACGAALLLNPRGIGLLRFTLVYADPQALRYGLIDEWQHPDIDEPSLLPFWLASWMALVAGWLTVRHRAAWPAATVLFFMAALHAQRYVPLYGLLLFPCAGWMTWARAARPRATPDAERTPLLPERRTLAMTAVVTVALLGLLLRLPVAEFGRVPPSREYPAAAAGVIEARAPGARLFNTYNWGGYLIYRLGPRIPVYIDGREEMYGDTFLQHYVDMEAGAEGTQAVIEQEGITAALVGPDSGIARVLAQDPAWLVAYRDAESILFLRVSNVTAR